MPLPLSPVLFEHSASLPLDPLDPRTFFRFFEGPLAFSSTFQGGGPSLRPRWPLFALAEEEPGPGGSPMLVGQTHSHQDANFRLEPHSAEAQGQELLRACWRRQEAILGL